MADKDPVVKVPCTNCGGDPRNHQLIYRYNVQWGSSDSYPYTYGFTRYDILKCMGCDSVRFRISETNSDDVDPETNEHTIYERGLFPDDAGGAPSTGRFALVSR